MPSLEPLDMESWVEGKLAELTLEEKALMLSGVDLWRTYSVPRLGIPQLKVCGRIPIRQYASANPD
jgi:hypothetical protein